MRDKQKILSFSSLLCNLFIVISTLICVISYFVTPHQGIILGFACFRYFTIDSNVLCMISAIIMMIFDCIALKKKGYRTPKWASAFKFVGVVSVTLTFMTVVFFLGPTFPKGYEGLFTGENLYLHLLVPLIAIMSYFVFELDHKISWNYSWIGIIPVAIYAIVYLVMVLFVPSTNGGWIDFYGFNINGLWYYSMPIMLLISYFICIFIACWHNLFRNYILNI